MSSRPQRDASLVAAARIAVDAVTRQSTDHDGQPTDDQFAEPDLDSLVPIISGRHIWAARRPTSVPLAADCLSPPLVPFEDLPFPKSDRAKLAPCTIRWQFTGRFNLNKEEALARGSLAVQVKRFLEFRRATDLSFLVNFPRGVGRGRFVDIHVHHTNMAALAETPLVYRGARLQRHLIGPSLPNTAMVVEITGFSEADDLTILARTVALFLQPFAQVHDIWLEMHSSSADATVRATNKLVALVETAATAGGGRDPSKVHAIPGYIKLSGRDCRLDYVGRLEWCTTCRSSTTTFHTFDNCPRRRCFRCDKPGHSAAFCPNEQADQHAAAMVEHSQMAAQASGADDLDYGTA